MIALLSYYFIISFETYINYKKENYMSYNDYINIEKNISYKNIYIDIIAK